MSERILPSPTPLTAPFFEGARQGELRLQRCDACQAVQFYPRPFCVACGAQALTWFPATGRGAIASFSVVHRGVSPAYEAPYVVALVDLEEGPRMMSHVVGEAALDVAVGDPVVAHFEAWSDDITMPVFKREAP